MMMAGYELWRVIFWGFYIPNQKLYRLNVELASVPLGRDCGSDGPAGPCPQSVGQSQKAVSAHFTSKQILPFDFAEQCWYGSVSGGDRWIDHCTRGDQWWLPLRRLAVGPTPTTCWATRRADVERRSDERPCQQGIVLHWFRISTGCDSSPHTTQTRRLTFEAVAVQFASGGPRPLHCQFAGPPWSD